MAEWACRVKMRFWMVHPPPCMLWEATSDHHGALVSCARRAVVPGLPWTAQTVPTPIISDKRRYGLGKAASGVATIIV